MSYRPLIVFLLLGLVSASYAKVRVAIIDSGVDYTHPELTGRMWLNPGEIKGNGVDDDGNSFVDDVYGWNFAENNNLVIDESYRNKFKDDVFKFFRVSTRIQKGVDQPGDRQWLQRKRKNPFFMFKIMTFGNYIHGTHVSDIATREVKGVELVAIKLIPTSIIPKIPGVKNAIEKELPFAVNDQLREMLLKMGLSQLAAAQGPMFKDIGQYIHSLKIKVANGSFGTGGKQAVGLVKPLFQLIWQRPATAEEELKYARFFLDTVISQARALVDSAPDTLFVFAAGNDGSDNDILPTSPASIPAPNVISVAATKERNELAVFSNYGKNMVHVGAPGVGILASIPDGKKMALSGTSQASPYVARVAARVFELNPNLTPVEVKRLIMGTIDGKSYLRGKVESEGIVNRARASAAAKLSINFSINKSIQQAKSSVSDINSPDAFSKGGEGYVLPLPSIF